MAIVETAISCSEDGGGSAVNDCWRGDKAGLFSRSYADPDGGEERHRQIVRQTRKRRLKELYLQRKGYAQSIG
jgi:hypothetical protein